MFSLEEYTAAKAGAALIDRSARGKISLKGQDRVSFLHALLTNDIARLTAGTGTYSAYLTPQGRMISDMRVIERGDQIVLDVEPSVAVSLAQRLDSLVFSEDVDVKNVTDDYGLYGLYGPSAAEVLERLMGIPENRLTSLALYDNVAPPSSSVTVVRDDAVGISGFDVYVPAVDAGRYLESFLEAGAVRLSDETAEALRIEAGRPKFGTDMDTNTIPLEAGLEDRAISLTKGCYVGQEVIIRVLHRGHGRVARKLVWLQIDGHSTPHPGDAITAAGQQIGRVTSAGFSPAANGPLALGYVQREYLTNGTAVIVNSEGAALHARVHQLGQQLGVGGREVEG